MLLALLIVGRDEQGVRHVAAQRLPIARAAQHLQKARDGGPDAGGQDDRGVEHHDRGGQVGVAGGEVEGHYAAHAVADYQRLLGPDPIADPRQVVGEKPHRVVLLRFVASAVPAQIHGHGSVAAAREVLELGGEVGVVAAPSVDQQDGRVPFTGLLVEQRHPVSLQPLHTALLRRVSAKKCSSRVHYTGGVWMSTLETCRCGILLFGHAHSQHPA
jgi:hypothetical protein